MEQNTDSTVLTKEELLEKADELKQKACQMHSKVVDGIDSTMCTTADKLDLTAEKLHETADYLKNKNVTHFENQIIEKTKEHPFKTLLGVFGFGLILGKIFFK